jgi:hypothetical protein
MYAKSLWNASIKAMNGHHQKDIPCNLLKYFTALGVEEKKQRQYAVLKAAVLFSAD